MKRATSDNNCDLTPRFPQEVLKDGQIFCPHIFAPVYGNIFLKVLINERYPREKQQFFYE